MINDASWQPGCGAESYMWDGWDGNLCGHLLYENRSVLIINNKTGELTECADCRGHKQTLVAFDHLLKHRPKGIGKYYTTTGVPEFGIK